MEEVTEVFSDEAECDESENEEEELENEVNNLENQIAQNKFAYQPYVDLIKTLKLLADLDRLRDARKRMSQQFPLSPELWLDWLQDEITLATSIEEKEKVFDLFKVAVNDYLSVEIWLENIKFCIQFQNEKNLTDLNFIRKTYEQALSAAGLHVTKGFDLWNTCIEFEKTVLMSLSKQSEEYGNQLKHIINLYKRQLSCPLWNMDMTFKNFKCFLEENSTNAGNSILDADNIKNIENIYKKAKKKLDEIKPFEDALESDPDKSLDIWKKYFEYEKSKDGSPVRVQMLYERFLCDNCLNEEFWLEYIEYVSTVLQNPDTTLNVCQRAVRNCSWCCRIYQAYIICLEKYSLSQKKITEVVEEAFASGLQTASDFRDVWMTYLEYLRRSFDAATKEEEEKRLGDLRAAFSKAVEFVVHMQDADPDYTIAQYWARIEAIYCKNLDKSRELWNSILANEQCKTAEMWLEYIHLERTFGDSKHLRKLYPRALQGTRDWPELIGKSWLNYERDEGTLESFENCVRKVSTRIKAIVELREKETVAATEPQPEKYSKKKSMKNEYNSYKKGKNSCIAPEKTENSLSMNRKRKNFNICQEDEPAKKMKSDEVKDEEVQSNNNFVERLLQNESKKLHGETVKHESSKDDRTVFVSNLDFSTEESSIRDIFSHCGTITDLRLVRDYKGRSKGYCYVEFQCSKEARVALTKDRELINGRPIFVSECDPDKETRPSGFKYSCGMEKNKLFVRGLPFSTSVDDLKELFSKFGTLKDVRVVTYRNGHSKGLAYVEFKDEAAAAQAVLSTDGSILQGKQISVAISNPPERKSEGAQTFKGSLSLGSGLREGFRGKSRTQISFVPRALTVNKQAAEVESMANLSLVSPLPQSEQKKLSNDDFRKFIGN